MLNDSKKDYVFSMTNYAFHPACNPYDAIRNVEMFHPEHFHTRSQDLEEVYHDAGQFYWGRVEAWLKERPPFTTAPAGYILP